MPLKLNSHQSALFAYLIPLVCGVQILTGCATDHGLVAKEINDDRINIQSSKPKQWKTEDICNALRHHIVQIDPDGQYKPVTTDLNCGGNDAYAQPNSLRDHLNNIRTHSKKTDKDITFIIHGGLVSWTTGLQEAIVLSLAILSDKNNSSGNRSYPIFINWHSGGIDAYVEQLSKIRKGERIELVGAITAPIKFLSDIGRGIADTPSLGALEGKRLYDTLDEKKLNSCIPKQLRWGGIVCPDDLEGTNDVLATSKYFLMTPFRIISAPFINGAGRPAWENMVRRTRNTFWQEPKDGKPAQRGVVRELFDSLFIENINKYKTFYLEPRDQNCDFAGKTINLIGHSMGTMIITELLHAYPQCPYENIVFMAAAVSIREFNQSLPRVLEQNDHVKFYNLSLQPKAEAREMSVWGFVPSGSLLEWIDEMYTSPSTKFDRTLGKWVNVREILPTIPKDHQERMTFRIFGATPGEPIRHGDFNNIGMCFWRESFWKSPWPEHYPACKEFLKSQDIKLK